MPDPWLVAFLWVGAAAVPDCTSLLQTETGTREGAAFHDNQRVRLTLANYIDLQYFVNLSVGSPPQTITSIIDTGSYELVVFSSSCKGCGLAGAFNHAGSSTHRLGVLVTQLTYGSGDVEGDQATDLVALGPARPAPQSFWEVRKAQMPLLGHAKFQSILGVGPPETPAADAWDALAGAVRDVAKSAQVGVAPRKETTAQVRSSLVSAMEISGTPTMLRNFRVRLFSLCLGRRPGSSGYLVWNDSLPLARPAAFAHLAVVGRHSWTLSLTEVRLGGFGPQQAAGVYLGCREGCGAIVDSGTSLLVMPSSAIALLDEALQGANLDCSGLQGLPSLFFTIDGTQLTLPPDSYMSRKKFTEPCRLELSVLHSTSTSKVGPLWILGMPFLRQYYTTFDVGTDVHSRKIHVAPAGGDCNPVGPGPTLAADRTRPYMRSLDRDRMYIPPLTRRVTTQAFVNV
mmetsp:Transcript_16137/g.47030  ORF Transcript_16137/g.47030 Transcript_16137/m.47030 type:complete len:456 (-) Transcript_16137:122-1489(-)